MKKTRPKLSTKGKDAGSGETKHGPCDGQILMDSPLTAQTCGAVSQDASLSSCPFVHMGIAGSEATVWLVCQGQGEEERWGEKMYQGSVEAPPPSSFSPASFS